MKNMELVYIWIEEYRNIKKQNFIFSPQFQINFDGKTLNIENNSEYVNELFGSNIRVTCIVGKNGSGKSNLLDYLIESSYIEFMIAIYIDHKTNELVIYSNNNFHKRDLLVANSSIMKHDKDVYDIMKSSFKRNRSIFDSLDYVFLKTFIDTSNTESFNINHMPKSNYFFRTNTRLDYYAMLHKASLFHNNITHIRESIDVKTRELDLNFIFDIFNLTMQNDIGNYFDVFKDFFFQHLKVRDITLRIKSIEQTYKYSGYKSKIKSNTLLNEAYKTFQQATSYYKLLLHALINLCVRDNNILSEAEKFKKEGWTLDKITTHILKQSHYNEHTMKEVAAWNSFIEVVQDNVDVEYNIKNDYETIKVILSANSALQKEINHSILDFSLKPSLSSGQERIAYLFIRLYEHMKSSEYQSNYFLVIDEIEALLHPQWQKSIFYMLIEFINKYFKDKSVQIILTTHSPFLLSNVPKQNVIFMKTYDDDDTDVQLGEQTSGNCKVIDGLNGKSETFGANIHTLLSDGFFMEEGLIGTFAKKKIEDLHQYIINKNNYIGNIGSAKEALRLISLIGEPVIKQQLKHLYDTHIGNIDIDMQILELEKKIIELKQNKKTSD